MLYHLPNKPTPCYCFFRLNNVTFLAHLHFAAWDPGTAVHSLQGDGVELALVQVHHRNLSVLVLGGLWCSENKLKIIPTHKDNTHRHTKNQYNNGNWQKALIFLNHVFHAWLTCTSQEESWSTSRSNQGLGGLQTHCCSLKPVWVKEKAERCTLACAN